VGPRVEPWSRRAGPGERRAARELRFDEVRPRPSPALSVNLAELGDVYVNEAFGAGHRGARLDSSVRRTEVSRRQADSGFGSGSPRVLSKLLADDVGRPFVAVLGVQGQRQVGR